MSHTLVWVHKKNGSEMRHYIKKDTCTYGEIPYTLFMSYIPRDIVLINIHVFK